MAMMTGRVLLVCALCVLWCGYPLVSAVTGEDREHSGQGVVGSVGQSSSPVGGHGDNGDVTDGSSVSGGSHLPGSAPTGGKPSLPGVGESVGLNESRDALTLAKEGHEVVRDQHELVPHVSYHTDAGTGGKSDLSAPEQSPNAKTKLENGGGVCGDDAATAEGEVITTVNEEQLGVSSTSDSHPPAADRGAKEQEGTVEQAASTAALTPVVGRETTPKGDTEEDSPEDKAATGAGITQDIPAVSQQQTHSSSTSTTGNGPTSALGKGGAAEDISNNNERSGKALLQEGAEHETVAGSQSQAIPAATARNTLGTTVSGDSDNSTTITTAVRSDTGTEGTPTSNHPNRQSIEGATSPGMNSDGEAVLAKKYDTVPQSAGSTAAPTTNNKTRDTASHGNSGSSTVVSHTTSPLSLLLVVVACAAAAAVVAGPA
ncbi:Mucin-associated surface protein (MASP) [Trypanosoma cruzi]|uniref:Mucin-associated surface protein (MASP), putative n=2 Tax=Trypanosoma cruzi TaxID=5693 RepID=Q4DNG1_TRYCC|nr:mucin-associated surface protein (MASP), putative [Trypanosoma cruzi]EAN94069.1 mucin-associated surface protein (MASP), putative [Trypanosoma cruzi]PWV15818.1 Mucin-associated surface protein (MASP) [Trypanosoma cruzi]|eukprot:XP_815920.1 mucin-associated surface protein (MASP) [Trypanosoma cruzi strain CL Brener]